MPIAAGLAIVYHAASRLAYVVWVGRTLARRHKRQLAAEPDDIAGFERFRPRAARLMANDAVSSVLLCVVTRDTIRLPTSAGATLVIAVLLAVTGIGTKIWAAGTLGGGAYYWHNFFVAEPPGASEPRGPYRWLSNPMYTVGYLQSYALALALHSLPGLIAALLDQAVILVFHHRVELPHFRAQGATVSSGPPSPRAAR